MSDTETRASAAALAPLRLLYGLYVWAAFLALSLLTVLALLLVPGLERRRAITRGGARLVLRLAGLAPEVRGLEGVPASQCVIVANHASYLDGIVMKAVLPPRFGFVIKREMDRVPLAGLLLRRIGSEFVERFDRRKGAADARRVLRTAASGKSLVFFPEGTFSRTRGLLKFHSGAFATAARARCPVVPAVIRGTRAVLPCSSLLARPGRIDVEFLPAIASEAPTAEAAAVELRDRARGAILARLGEPDLAASPASPGEPLPQRQGREGA